MRARSLITAVSAMALAGIAALPAGAATPNTIANWQMNEPAGATVMQDTSGNGRHGDIGAEVLTGVSVDGSTGYRFALHQPNVVEPHISHNVVVPHNSALNPNNRAEYAVEIRYRTTRPFGNITQKGQAGNRGGYWKIQLPQGEPSCLFRGPTGVTNSTRARGFPVNDGQWHVVRCVATPTDVKLYVDGVFRGRNTGTTGSIANTVPLQIGGKLNCDQVETTCDYYSGDVDYLRIESS
jgi:hypothetical protein